MLEVQQLRWLVFAFLTTHSSSTLTCPSPERILPCQCAAHGEEIQIWCSHGEVSKVLAGLQNVASDLKGPVDELIIENNVLPSLPGQAFRSLNVTRLMLRDNGLQRVTANWLAGLETSLVEIFIVEPELRSLPDESFESLLKLEAVTLHAGGITRLPVLNNLRKLRYLHFKLPSLVDIPPGRLKTLPSLEQIHILNSPRLERLEQGVFDDLPMLMLINITESGLNRMHPRALARLPALSELSLTNNRITDAGIIGRSIRELPSLAILKLDGNDINRIMETSFVDIPPIRELHLPSNNIYEIHRGAFHRLPLLKVLNLNDNRIRRIHSEFFLQPFDSELEELHLVQNELDHALQLRILLEALPRLRFLDLSYNRIQEITYGIIHGHSFLERLHLDHNRLKRVARDSFAGMPALRELRLRNNSLTNYLDMPLWNLPALKGLDLAYNKFHRLDRTMLNNTPSLRRLDISGNALVSVDEGTFMGTPSLEHVNLSHNALLEIHPMTFQHLMNLYELDVGDNRLRTMVPGLPPVLEYLHMPRNQMSTLPMSNLRLLSLKHLDITGNGIHHLIGEAIMSMPLLRTLLAGENSLQNLDEHTLEGLGRMETLDLHGNRVLTINDNAFKDLRRLQTLNLQGNRLENLNSMLLKENILLRNLDISWNLITQIKDLTFANNRALERLIMSHNVLTELPNDLNHLSELKTLDLSNNKIRNLPSSMNRLSSLEELYLAKNKLQMLGGEVFSEMPNLKILDLDGNDLEFITPHAIRSLPNLTAVRLCRNKLATLPSATFSNLPSLLFVELQENQLTDVASDAFTAVPGLLMLNLSFNHLSGFEQAGLQGLHSLEVLDLSHNKLSRIEGHGLPVMQSLVQLKVDNNRLCNIQSSSFRKMLRLRDLSLRNNKMTSLSEATFRPLKHGLYNLEIDGNPLRCSCGLQWLQVWLRESPYLRTNPVCHDGTYLRNYRMTHKDCYSGKGDDLPVPGCDNLPSANSAPVIGPTQQLSSYIGGDINSTLKPSPEESEYFYDEYIEFEENITIPMDNTSPPPSTTTQTVPTIPPGIMSHFIPGDTPTLYAGTKPHSSTVKPQIVTQHPTTAFTFFGVPIPTFNMVKPQIVTQHPTTAFTFFGVPIPTFNMVKPQIVTQHPTTAFTFFGVPIPTFNMGGFWGAGRDVDGRGRFTSNRGRGRVQQLPPVMQEGFTPMLPGNGGFTPIFNPMNYTKEEHVTQSYRHELLNHSQWDIHKNSLPHATISKVFVPGKELKPQEVTQFQALADTINTKNSSAPKNTSQSVAIKVWEFNPEPSSTTLFQTSGENITEDPLSFIITAPDETTSDIITDSSSAFFLSSTTDKNTGKDPIQALPSKIPAPSTFLSDLWSSVSQSSGPSSLSDFLAPGGQLPPYKSSGGRPTITKVTVQPPLGPGPIPMAEDLQGPIPRQAKSPPEHYYTVSTERPQRNHAMDWYFNNYNQTNLEPFVGPGKTPRSGQPFSQPLSYVILISVLFPVLFC